MSLKAQNNMTIILWFVLETSLAVFSLYEVLAAM